MTTSMFEHRSGCGGGGCGGCGDCGGGDGALAGELWSRALAAPRGSRELLAPRATGAKFRVVWR